MQSSLLVWVVLIDQVSYDTLETWEIKTGLPSTLLSWIFWHELSVNIPLLVFCTRGAKKWRQENKEEKNRKWVYIGFG